MARPELEAKADTTVAPAPGRIGGPDDIGAQKDDGGAEGVGRPDDVGGPQDVGGTEHSEPHGNVG
ncbi:hypothetical protein [Salinibacterium sp. ZJ454]|uniref:hypothetical protein n=1 Tax=Salinibacterium sp. ZJ454 TaxID=2708339 RepID=UPI00141DB5B3|nr:hypothetical protein [Salinibacterium sp. ZJ454]